MGTEISLLTVLLTLVYQSNGYRTGAPTGVCQSMMPNHDGNQPQNSVSPYEVLVDQTSYTSGSVITVTLNSTTGEPFKGYLMQMRRSDTQAIVGVFTLLGSGQLLSCSSQNNAVTHTENGDKDMVRFNWTAPSQTVGQVRIVATVVQTKPTFWTQIQSSLITEVPSTATEDEIPITSPYAEPENSATIQILNCSLLFGIIFVHFF